MGTVNKAMTVLEAFSVEQPEFGLSELARRVGFDKATTLRLLSALQAHGLVEKIEARKRYRIGPAALRLARIRSEIVSLADIAQPTLEQLRDETGESCHVSEAGATSLTTVLAVHSPKALRINIAPGEKLPFHCTASGVAFLAFARPGVLERVAKGPLPKITRRSKTSAVVLRQQVEETRARGFSINNGEYDEDAVSVAAPLIDGDGFAIGAISVAAPRSRVEAKLLARHGQLVQRAAQTLSSAWSGTLPGRKSSR